MFPRKAVLLALWVACGMVAGRPGAAAVGAIWQPFERPAAGSVGSGDHSVVKGMAIFTTAPAKPYRILGLICARSGGFGSARTRAVALAKKVGAHALLLLDTDPFAAGADPASAGDDAGYRIHYTGVVYYAAMQWPPADPAPLSAPKDGAGGRSPDRADRALPAHAAPP